MKEAMETPSDASNSTGWDELSEVPFVGQNKEVSPDDIDDLWGEDPWGDNAPSQPNESVGTNAEERISEEELRDLTARMAAETAFDAISSVAGAEVADQYKKRIPDIANASYDELKPVVNEINQIVKQDWVSRMTDLDSYQPGDNYHFICQSIHDPYKASEYLGNYASCSLLTDEIHVTYSAGFGFIYAPEDIVAASGDDLNLENRATNDDDVMRMQSIPTIDSIDNVLKEQKDRMAKYPDRREYNEVGVRAGKPIGIFCLTDGKDDGSNPFSNYAMALELQRLNPDLKLAVLPKETSTAEDQPQSNASNDWEADDGLIW